MAANEHEINRRRRNSQDSQVSSDFEDDDFTKLSLYQVSSDFGDDDFTKLSLSLTLQANPSLSTSSMAANEHEINRKRRNDSKVSLDFGDDDFTKLSLYQVSSDFGDDDFTNPSLSLTLQSNPSLSTLSMAANDHEINRKRRNSHDSQVSLDFGDDDFTKLSLSQGSSDFGDDDFTKLSLSTPGTTRPRLLSPPPRPPFQEILPHLPPPLQLPPSHPIFMAPPPPPPPPPPPAAPPHQQRARKNPYSKPRLGKGPTVLAPFPWATTHRATVHSLHHLLQNQIHSISGQVQCKRCDQIFEIEYEILQNFIMVGKFILKNKSVMHDRAPDIWLNPTLPTCRFCNQENSSKPIISEHKNSINWLFLLLGQLLGCCTLDHLKYFCKHTNNHRTGAKDRVLYLTYLGLCKQLDPTGPFDATHY